MVVTLSQPSKQKKVTQMNGRYGVKMIGKNFKIINNSN
jgi:hypothetical protein